MEGKIAVQSRKLILEELKSAFKGIQHNYRYFYKENKKRNKIIGAGEWLLDNIYLIQKEYKTIKLNLPIEYFANLPFVLNEEKSPRIYIDAKKFINKETNITKEDKLIEFIKNSDIDYRIGEIWALPLMLRIRLIINLATIINSAVIIQKQRDSGRVLANRVVDAYNNGKLRGVINKLESEYKGEKNYKNINNKYMGDNESLHDGYFSIEFVDSYMRVLKDNSVYDEEAYRFVESRINSDLKGNIQQAETKEYFKEGIIEGTIANIIGSLRTLESINWKSFFERTSKVEGLLNKDNVYRSMDFDTKDTYRHKIEEISRKLNIDELNLTETILQLSNRNLKEAYKNHVGYYLIDNGLEEISSMYNYYNKLNKNMMPQKYITLIIVATLAIEIIMAILFRSLLLTVVTLIPVSEIVIAISNWIVTKSVPPNFVPKMDYSKGIPKNEKTIIVIPTLVSSPNRVKELIDKLEICYLANKDSNLYFAILGDFIDSKEEFCNWDEEINKTGIEYVKNINNKYYKEGNEHFFFFNRRRVYNKAEGIYMGYERKRGKIIEFMALLKGESNNSYNIISSSINNIQDCKYLITLDLDTVLPIGEAKRLVGAISHPLNIPVIDNNHVVRGYSIIQPRVAVSIESKFYSYFSTIFAGDTGIDTYSTAYSDVYEDLFGEGIFTGKGIINIDTFYYLLKDSIPENSVLSHDLLEGELTKCALATDITVIDGYPATYIGSSLRLHRWTRGDWQLIKWLSCKKLSILSKYKIIDNLRRSLLAPSLLIGLLIGLTVFSGYQSILTLFLLSIMLPLVFTIADFVVTPKSKLIGSFKSLKQLLLIVSFIPYQGYMMIDAIVRTLFRLTISKKNLLQWQTAEDAERNSDNSVGGYCRRMWANSVSAVALFILSFNNSVEAGLLNVVICVLWVLGPIIAANISKGIPDNKYNFTNDEELFLKDISRRIFAYYQDFVNEENNYLAPDNYQEIPNKGIAHRTSPTNMGMGLISHIIAYHMGYITMYESVNMIELILDEMETLQKWNGHYLNWYDTRTKEPLWPRYVSTVDSGNLLGYLMIVREQLIKYNSEPIIRVNEIQSLEEIFNIINNELDVDITFKNTASIESYREILEEIIEKIEGIDWKSNNDKYWILKLKEDVDNKLEFYDYIFKDIEKFLVDIFRDNGTLNINQLIEFINEIKIASGSDYATILESKINRIENFKLKITTVVSKIDEIMESMDFTKLFSKDRELFAIGYNIEEDSLGNSYYDLMASESRATSFITIARGEIPLEHWYKLSRSIASTYGNKALVSWSGTMFEYFMPFQIMKNYKGTLWDLTYKSVIKSQYKYGSENNISWGISESAYYEFDSNEIYQYKAFGVPGVGLKRGLEDELVVSPYSTIMTLDLSRKLGMENLLRLKSEGHYGRYGFIEAIDYTPWKLRQPDDSKEVRCYMVHHLGMSLMALDNVLNNNVIQELFHSIPMIKSAELLLKESIPEHIIFEKGEDRVIESELCENEEFIPRIINGPLRDNYETLVLSNGSYSTMITQTGSGYSKKNDMSVYRWEGDTTSDSLGMLFYIRDVESNYLWSPSYEPIKSAGEEYIVDFRIDGGKFSRKDKEFDTNYEVIVSARDDVEIRGIYITNNGESSRKIEITSYMEAVLTTFQADVVHPAFSNLFVSTEFNNESKVLLANRRPRTENGESPWLYHKVVGEDEEDISWETARLNFIGRNRGVSNPISIDKELSNTTGIVLDPIMSIRKGVTIEPGETKKIYYITGVSKNKNDAISLADKYSDIGLINSQRSEYNHAQQLELRSIGIKSVQANIYQSLTSYLFYLNLGRENRDTYISNISMHQKDLWPYGISGDLPIVMLIINNEANIDLIRQGITMHYYWRLKGIKSDLIIYNEEVTSYDEPLQKLIIDTIGSSLERDNVNKSAGIFTHSKATMSYEVKAFVMGIASIVINCKEGSLIDQLNSVYLEIRKNNLRHKEISNNEDIIVRSKETNQIEDNSYRETKLDNMSMNNCSENRNNQIMRNDFNKEELEFYNGYGGFNPKTNSYIIHLTNKETTPLPWINVISNKDFGFHISEVGATYTWCGNSRENKITPWNNDWVSDETGEGLYIKDNKTGNYFTITPMPVRDNGEYFIEHGFGYSKFKHTANNIQGEVTVFSPIDEKVKLYKISLLNLTDIDRELTIYYYAQLVLGVNNYNSARYINTNLSEDYIWSQNPYSEYFGKYKTYLTILTEDNSSVRFTGNREEFIGVGGDISCPNALRKESLSNTVGSIYDPCLAAESKINLNANGIKEIVIVLGAEEHLEEINRVINKYSNYKFVNRELKKVNNYWKEFLGGIKVSTPDKSMDYLLNGWLMYQTLSCRHRARTAFYQSGGAIGFRDQLQDSMALGILDSNITREQILINASRQYIEGDVQHWWHPVVNSGIRTRFSDDLLWLPYVVSDYIRRTGDYKLLDEEIQYLDDEPLRPGEDERYTIVNKQSRKGTIYEHCLKAIEKSLKFGEHGIPLMGSGDWNDGMSTVGNKGKGESIWLGWFLYKILNEFKDIALYVADGDTYHKYNEVKEFIRENIEKNGWDGAWYRRAYFDDGTPLGSHINEECRIDSISQSWSIISEGGDKEHVIKAMESVDRELVKKDKGMILLLTPAFDKSDLSPGYIKGYVPGVRENGGQYTHSAVWSILALTKLGLGDKAVEYYNMINPINHSKDKSMADRYMVEPYVMAADVYENNQHPGRGGWSWYTGAAGWMYKVGIENILGLQKYKGIGYKINPCVPKVWKEYSLYIKDEVGEYNIKVKRGSESCIIINGSKHRGDYIPKMKGKNEIEVFF